MQATLRREVTDPRGRRYPPGTPVTLVESRLVYAVDLGDGRTVRVSGDDLRVRCEVPGCGRRASYEAPGEWCSVHWQEWWDHPKGRPHPPWMRERDEREPSSFVSLARDLVLDGRPYEKGAPVSRVAEHLVVEVHVGQDVPDFQVERADLSIRCEAPDCEEEAQLWHPCYCCRAHYYAWLDDDFPLPGGEKAPLEEVECPAWQRGPGAGRPDNYPEMSAREQWAIDKRLGILDEEW